MNLLDYKIDWAGYSVFDRRPFLEKYNFLLASLFHLSQLPDTYGIQGVFTPRQDELIYEFGSFRNDSNSYNRPLNLSIVYLELFCKHDKILKDIREQFRGLSSTEFNRAGYLGYSIRLKNIIINSIRDLRKSFQLIELDAFFKQESIITPDQIDSYLEIRDHFTFIKNAIISLESKPYTELVTTNRNNKIDLVNLKKSKLRLDLNKDHFIDKGISFDSFEGLSHELENSTNQITSSYEQIQNELPNTPQSIAIIDIPDFHHRLQNISEALIKLGVLFEIKIQLNTEENYRPRYFSVKGPQDAVNKYGQWLVDRYEIHEPGSLADKIKSICIVVTPSGEIAQLKKESIMRAILRKKLFTKNSNI